MDKEQASTQIIGRFGHARWDIENQGRHKYHILISAGLTRPANPSSGARVSCHLNSCRLTD